MSIYKIKRKIDKCKVWIYSKLYKTLGSKLATRFVTVETWDLFNCYYVTEKHAHSYKIDNAFGAYLQYKLHKLNYDTGTFYVLSCYSDIIRRAGKKGL